LRFGGLFYFGTMMFCKNCKNRDSCKKACHDLNKYLSKLTKKQSRKTVLFSSVPGSDGESPLEYIIFKEGNPSFWPSGDYDTHIILDRLKPQIMSRLSPRQRECVDLHYYQNLSTYKIATILGISQPCVMNYLKKAKNKLRGLLPDG